MNSNWVFDSNDTAHHARAVKALARVKAEEAGKKFKAVRVDAKTVKLVEI